MLILSGHHSRVHTLAFAPDGRRWPRWPPAAIASTSGTWPAANWRPRRAHSPRRAPWPSPPATAESWPLPTASAACVSGISTPTRNATSAPCARSVSTLSWPSVPMRLPGRHRRPRVGAGRDGVLAAAQWGRRLGLDPREGAVLHPLFLTCRGFLTSLAFAPDGRTIAAGSLDRNVYLWDVEREDPLGGAGPRRQGTSPGLRSDRPHPGRGGGRGLGESLERRYRQQTEHPQGTGEVRPRPLLRPRRPHPGNGRRRRQRTLLGRLIPGHLQAAARFQLGRRLRTQRRFCSRRHAPPPAGLATSSSGTSTTGALPFRRVPACRVWLPYVLPSNSAIRCFNSSGIDTLTPLTWSKVTTVPSPSVVTTFRRRLTMRCASTSRSSPREVSRAPTRMVSG